MKPKAQLHRRILHKQSIERAPRSFSGLFQRLNDLLAQRIDLLVFLKKLALEQSAPVCRVFRPQHTERGTTHLTNRETLTLVLLDNDDEIQTVMELGLKRHCFRVLPARTPAEAAQLLHHYPIEVLVADVGVLQPRPVQALQRIEEEQPRTRVMLISGYDRATVSDRYKGLLIGREFLPKPFSPLLLATVLRQMAP